MSVSHFDNHENTDLSQSISTSQVTPKKDSGVTPRVVIFSLLLAVVLGYLIPIIDYKYMNTFLGGTHFPPGAIGALLILVLVVNPLAGLVSNKLKFTRNEALTVYITCLFSCLVPGHGAENFLVPNLLAPFYFATRENKWLEGLSANLEPWLTPALNSDGTVNQQLLDGWYLAQGAIPWQAWIAPLMIWGVLVLAIYVMLACLATMLRAQWAEREALAFPLLRLPLQLTEDMESPAGAPKFFKNGLMWGGFGIAVFIQLLRGLNLYFPDVPTFPLDLNMSPYLRDAPWNQMGGIPLIAYPIAIGIAFLLTSEVSFSLWFFFLFIKLQLVACYMLGYPAGVLPKTPASVPGGTFLGYQIFGCYLVFVALLLWMGREHFGHILRRAFGRVKGNPAEGREVMSYPVAFWGFLLSFSFIVGWMYIAGIRPDISIALWAVYIIYAIGLTRVVVEGGMLAVLNDCAPLGMVSRLFSSTPSNWLSDSAGLVPASFVQGAFGIHMRGFIMPSFLHAFKLAHDRDISPKPLLALISVVVLVSATIGMIMAVKIGHENGGLSLTHRWWATMGSLHGATFSTITRQASDNMPLWNWGGLAFGGTLTYLIMLMRSRFAWFPFHPIGYLMAGSYPGSMFWFSIMLGWMFKVIILRFGGSDAYRRMIPAFLGLAFGDVAMMLFWLCIDGWQGRMSHALMPQ
jgi:hypothetical protein